jgi:tRNA dimethylallyltransferase
MNKILIICGPTGSGKTALSVECAKRLNTEIISADSLLVYKDLNIGTAKPDKKEMKGIKHHLIDIVDPDKKFSVSDYEGLALPIVEDLLNRNKVPIICGGTGFYIDSILFKKSFGLFGGDETIREKYVKILSEYGNEYLFNILKKKDFETSKILHPNDTKRVIRALEIFDISGKKKSEQKDELISRYNYTAISINYKRADLYNRINQRVDLMIEKGLIDEVKYLISKGINIENQSMQGIGYKEVFDYLKNNTLQSSMSDIIKKSSRNYAKRQITYFNKLKNLIYIEPNNDIKIMADEVINLL